MMQHAWTKTEFAAIFKQNSIESSFIFALSPSRCFGMLLSPGQKVSNSDMHLLDMVSSEQMIKYNS